MAARKQRGEVEESSGNIFADLGFPNPERDLLKAHLTLRIYGIIKKRGLTQAQLAAKAGFGLPYIGRLEIAAHPEVPISTVARLAKALNVKPGDLLK